MIKSFQEYIEKDKEVREYKNKTLELIKQFIQNSTEFKSNHNLKDNFSPPINLILNTNLNKFMIQLLNGHIIEFTQEEHNNLQEFIENPTLYLNKQNYNL